VTANWKQGGERYLPALGAAEGQFAIPTDLLARIAYQESHWREQIVQCREVSRAGCLGLMQLNPVFYPGAGKDWRADVLSAARALADHYVRFKVWQWAVASYDWGEGNVHRWLNTNPRPAMPQETSNYLVAVFADIAVPAALNA
jgi:soluble lytic murein transglycosylase-like protein